MASHDSLTVCYNGACPVCRAEIAHYRRQAGTDVRFLDVAADPAGAARLGLGDDARFRRMHAVDGAGRTTAGIDAFTAVWSRLPRYRWLARLMAYPMARQTAGWLYERLAAPLLYWLHRRRQRRR